ncbi:hypothetical protein V2J09_015081 [Rumex salicifolius]
MENAIGLLRIRVRRGINLVARDCSSSDPYVTVTMASQKLKTKVVKNNCNPEWNDELTLAILSPDTPVILSVYDKDKFSKDDAMGDADVDIQPMFECRKMELRGVASGTVLTRAEPNRRNCLAEQSEVICKDGKILQDMKLRLKNAQSGQVVIQLEWIDIIMGLYNVILEDVNITIQWILSYSNINLFCNFT